MDRLDRQARADHQPQYVRHDLLYLGRFPRHARDRWRDRDVDPARSRFAWADHGEERGRSAVDLLVLALRGWSLDRGVLAGVHRRHRLPDPEMALSGGPALMTSERDPASPQGGPES